MTMFNEQGDKLKGLIDNMVDNLQFKRVNTTIVGSIHYHTPFDYVY